MLSKTFNDVIKNTKKYIYDNNVICLFMNTIINKCNISYDKLSDEEKKNIDMEFGLLPNMTIILFNKLDNNTKILENIIKRFHKLEQYEKSNNIIIEMYTIKQTVFSINNPIYDLLKTYLLKSNDVYKITSLDVNVPLVLLYDNMPFDKSNKTVGAVENMLKGLNYYNYNYIVTGVGQKWENWPGRMKQYISVLKLLPKNQLIILSDARDVFMNNDMKSFMTNYYKLLNKHHDINGNKIIFSTEQGCCVGNMWRYKPGDIFSKNGKIKHSYDFMQSGSLYWEPWYDWNTMFIERFKKARREYNLNLPENYDIINLNFGLIVCKAEILLNMFIFFDMQQGPKGDKYFEDDQHLASEYFYIFPENVIMDYEQTLLSNTGYKHSLRKCTGNTEKNVFYNVDFNDHNTEKLFSKFNKNIYKYTNERGKVYEYDIKNNKYKFIYNNHTSYPTLIQSPGKDWNSYNELIYKLPYCNLNMCSIYSSYDVVNKINVRNIITNMYIVENGNYKLLKTMIDNVLNPIYIALDLIITKDIFDMFYHNSIEGDIILNGGNLLGYLRYNKLDNTHFMPWDDDIDIGWICDNMTPQILKNFFNIIINKGYDIFVYYKNKNSPHSNNINDHKTINLNKFNKNIDVLFDNNNEIVLFNINISQNKYKKILEYFNIDTSYEQIYNSGGLKFPSVDVFIYIKHKNTYINDKLFGTGKIEIIKEENIYPIKKNISYNNITVNIPNNMLLFIKDMYDVVDMNKMNNIYMKVHDSPVNYDAINNMELRYDNANIILYVKIYNNYVNMYYNYITYNINVLQHIIYN